jgi:hypothetical protein
MCLICQQKTTEPLRCPLNAKGSKDKSEPYFSFLNSVSAFRGLGTLPVVLNFEEHMTVEQGFMAQVLPCQVQQSKAG